MGLGAGNNAINIGINATNNASGVIGTVTRDLDNLSARGGAGGGALGGGMFSPGNLAMMGAAAYGITQVGAAVYDLGENAAQVEAVGNSFEGLAAKAGLSSAELLDALKATSSGTISEYDIMLAANKALLLGVADSNDEFIALLSVAKSRGQAMGQDVTKSFDDLVTGVGRGSALILDNLGFSTLQIAAANEAYAQSLGIAVDEMDDAQKKAALLNVIMAEAAEMGAIPESSLDSYQRLGAEMEDLKANIGDLVQPVSGGGTEAAAQVLASVNDGLNFLNRSTVEIEQELAAIDSAMQGAQLRFEQNRQLVAEGVATPAIMDAYIASLRELNGLELRRTELTNQLNGVTRSNAGAWIAVGEQAQAAAEAESQAVSQTEALAAAREAAQQRINAAAQLGKTGTGATEAAATLQVQQQQTAALDALAAAQEAAVQRMVTAQEDAQARLSSLATLGAPPAAEADTLAANDAIVQQMSATGAEAGAAMSEAMARTSGESIQAVADQSGMAFVSSFTAGIAKQSAGITGSGARSGSLWLNGFLAQVQAGIGGQLISILAAALVGPVASAIAAEGSRKGAD